MGLLPAERDGRWNKLRASPDEAEANLETQIRPLEALGYASGTKTALSLSGVTLHEIKRAQEGTQHWRHAQPFDNGDLLAIHQGLGLVKLDKASNVIWARRNGAHHQFHVLPNGDIAALAREARLIERVDANRPILEDLVLILDGNGREKERYSVLEAFERSAQYRTIWDEATRRSGDLFHTNSIRVLDGLFSGLDPAFAQGNFLLSSRHLNTVFCGAAQRLPNGNTLITESDNGRAFEVTVDGAIVWEFYNPHRAGERDEFIAMLFRLDRLPADFPIDWASPTDPP